MIWKRLRKSTPEEEEAFDRALEEQKLTFKDRLAIMGTAIVMLVLPSIAVLVGLSAFMLWIFGLL